MKQSLKLGNVEIVFTDEKVTCMNGTVPIATLTTTNLKSEDHKADKMDWGFLDSDQMDALNEDIHNARVGGVETLLLALLTSGAITLDGHGVREALVTTLDSLANEFVGERRRLIHQDRDKYVSCSHKGKRTDSF